MSQYSENYFNLEKSFTLKAESEVAGLPDHQHNNLKFGSDALVVPTGNVYILTDNDQWTLLGGDA